MISLPYPHTVSCANHYVAGDYPCDCEREAAKLARKAQRDRAVAAVTKALAQHGVQHGPSGIAHVVLVTSAHQSPMYLSLKSRRDAAGYTLYRYRRAGTSYWLTKRRDDFFAWLLTPPAPRQLTGAAAAAWHMPFGQYRGQMLGDIALRDESYLPWLLEKNFLREPLRQAVQEVVALTWP